MNKKNVKKFKEKTSNYDVLEYINNLEQENQQLKERINTLKDTQLKQLNMIQQRDEVIEEAINLVKKYCVIFEGMEDYPIDLHNEQVKELLDILQKYKGDNNE